MFQSEDSLRTLDEWTSFVGWVFFFAATRILFSTSQFLLISDDDVVDGDVDEFYEESDEAHNAESDGGGDSNLLELFAVGLGASLD